MVAEINEAVNTRVLKRILKKFHFIDKKNTKFYNDPKRKIKIKLYQKNVFYKKVVQNTWNFDKTSIENKATDSTEKHESHYHHTALFLVSFKTPKKRRKHSQNKNLFKTKK